MLRFETLPPSFAALLATLRPCFTAPSFHTFATVLAGMVAAPGRRTVTGWWSAAGQAGVRHHARAYWFLGRARWSVEQVSAVLTRLVVGLLVDPDEAVLVAVDDTLFRRSGRRVHAAFWHHDGAAAGPGRAVAWGNNWVLAAIVVRLPFRDRPMALPVGFALWQPQTDTKQVLCCRLVARIAAALPGRVIHVVADAAYAGADGAPGATTGANRARGLPAGISLTSRLRANAKLHATAVPVPGRGGRPRTIGAVLGTPKDLAAGGGWHPLTVTRYGRTDTVEVIDQRCLWYGSYRSRPIRVILVRDPAGTATAGYDLALISTDLTAATGTIITRYADRWPIETMIEDAKQATGVGQARTRVPAAVERTVPLGLTAHTLTVLWYARHGHHPADVTNRQHAAPWYRTKTEPAYHDMIIKLRRTLIAARFRAGKTRIPTPEETLAVHLAWADAAA
jgi:DDE superfamily endonuclease